MTAGPGTPIGRSRLIWIVLAAVMILGATTLWWSRRGSSLVEIQAKEGAGEATDPPPGAATRTRPRDPVGHVLRLAGKDDPATINQLIHLYGQWAAFPETLEARKLALRTLLAHPNVTVALEAVLTAVEGDQTRREQDPMWRDLVAGVGKLWDAVTFPLGRDRMYTEERSKPRDLLLESLLEIRPQAISDAQRTQLTSDLIDLHATMKPDQKAAADRSLGALGGGDLVEILAGRGLSDDSKLKVVADRNRAIEAARAIRLPVIVPDEDNRPPDEVRKSAK